MLNSSPVLAKKRSTGRISPATSWADIARAVNRNRRHRAVAEGKPADWDYALQAVMAELVRGRTGVKPEDPLPLERQRDGRQSWMVQVWDFDTGFFVLEIASTTVDAAQEKWTTRYEFIPMALR